MIEIAGLDIAYGAVQAVRGISLRAERGRITALLGANGAGKSSVIRAIMGLVDYSGVIKLDGRDLTGLSSERRARMGLGCVLEGRRLFRNLTVEENLELAWGFGRRKAPFAAMRDEAFGHFPILAEKRRIESGLLSGGQQQMLIISSAMIRSPDFLLLDEPSLGLAPIIVQQLFDFIAETTRSLSMTTIMTEQMAALALRIADHGYIMRQGKVVLDDERAALLSPEGARKLAGAYL